MTNEPLASRFRPQTLDDIIGQDHILGPGKMLTRLIQSDSFGCLIFYGPPGTGKTTIASVIAHTTHADFRAINATTSGKADMQKIIAAAEETKRTGRKRYYLSMRSTVSTKHSRTICCLLLKRVS